MNKKLIVFPLSFLIIGYLLFKLFGYFLVPVMTRELRFEDFTEMQLTKAVLGTLEQFFLLGLNLIIGIYLVILSRKSIGFGIIWFLMGVIFGLNALILFYLIKLVGDSKSKSDNDILEDSHTKDF